MASAYKECKALYVNIMSAVKGGAQTHIHPEAPSEARLREKRRTEGYDSVDFINFPLFIAW